MASRSYNLAFDNPYNRQIADVLQKYDMNNDTNGEPDLLHYTNSRLQGGSMEPMEFKHPHLLHMSKDMPYTPLPRPLRRYADVSIGAGRPAGMVSPYVEAVDPRSIIDSGTSAVYPIYNALELRAVGGCMCDCPMVDKVVVGSGKKSKSIGKTILKEVVPIAKDIGVMAVKELTKEAIKSAFKSNKSGSGRKRKQMKTQMEPEPKPEDTMSIAIIDEGGMMMEMNDKRSDKEKKEDAKKLQKLTKKVFTGGAKDGRAKRAEIVKKIMKEKGMKMIEASKWVKENNLYQK
jgi:hypothetical protein